MGTVIDRTGRIEHKAASVGSGATPTADPHEFTIIGSVTGVPDLVDDLIVPGAYAKTLARRTPKVIKDHDWKQRLGKVLSIEEYLPGDARLPKRTPRGAPWPAAAGALVAKVRLFNSTAGQEAMERWREYGAEQEFSVGYVAKQATKDPRTGLRHLEEMDLFELSDVLFGAMPMSGAIPEELATKVWAGLAEEEALSTDVDAAVDTVLEAKYDTSPVGEDGGRQNWVDRCFPADVLVASGSPVYAAHRYWHDGLLVKVRTMGGVELSATPNHPLLTIAGWQAIKDLQLGEKLVLAPRSELVGRGEPGVERMPACIGEIYGAADKMGLPERIRTDAVHFHGDVPHGDIDVVEVDGELSNALNTVSLQHSIEGSAPDAETLGDPGNRLPAAVTVDEIVHVETQPFQGHVYDLSTVKGWYVANGIIVHNSGGLPPFLRAVAHALIRDGKSESQAIRIAYGTIKRWAAGGGSVSAKTRAKAAAVVAWWEAHTGAHKGLEGAVPLLTDWTPTAEVGPHAAHLPAPERPGEFRVETKDIPYVAGSWEERREMLSKALNAFFDVRTVPNRSVSTDATFEDWMVVTVYDRDEVRGKTVSTYRIPYDIGDNVVVLGEPRPATLSVVVGAGENDYGVSVAMGGLGDAMIGAKLLGLALENKAGRVLSGANSGRIATAVKELIAVLRAAGVAIDAPDDNPTEQGRQPADPTQAPALMAGAEAREIITPAALAAAAIRLRMVVAQ